jgi:hypothetical protein
MAKRKAGPTASVSVPQTWPEQAPTVAPLLTADADVLLSIEDPDKFGGIVAASKFIIDRLIAAGLAHELVMPPAKLGLHPCNRGKSGCHEDSVHQLAADIVEVGWDWDKVRGALCVEDDPADRYIQNYNATLCNPSDHLAPVEPRSIVAGTLTNGHTVLLLRALTAGVKCTLPAVSVDGRMSIAHVESTRPDMAKAAREGWKWTMLSACTRKLYGDKLFEFLSGVHNINLARTEHECEVLLKIFRQAIDFEKAGQPIDWSAIQRCIFRTKPECMEYVPSMIKFVQGFGGGPDANFVQDLCRFHQKHVAGQRLVGGSFFELVTSLAFVDKESKASRPAPLLRYAFLKAEYRCPPDRVENRLCKFITKSDLDTLSKKSVASAFEADGILSKCRELVLSLGDRVSEDMRTRLFGVLDVNVARVILKKQQSSTVKYSTVAEVASSFVNDLRAALVDDSIANPWAGSEVKCAPHHAPLSNGMATFTASGDLVLQDMLPTLKAKGFDIGMQVSTKSGSKCSVHGISSDMVHLRGEAGETIDVKLDKFFSNWHKHEEVFFPFTDNDHSNGHQQFQMTLFKGAVHFAMGMLAQSVGKPNVAIQAKPSKRVIANVAFKASACVLIPESMNISAVLHGCAPPSTASAIDMDGDVGFKMFVQPQPMQLEEGKKPLISPFWAVQTTTEASDANVQWTRMSCTIYAKIGGKAAVNHEIKFWAISNHKPLKKDDELLIFRSDPKDMKASSSSAPPAKKKKSN